MSDDPIRAKFAREAVTDATPDTTAIARRDPTDRSIDKETGGQRVVIVGLDIPFFHLVVLYIALVFAAIPAAIIVGIIVVAIRALIGAVMR